MEGKWLGVRGMGDEARRKRKRRGRRKLPLGAIVSDWMVYWALCEREGYVRFKKDPSLSRQERSSVCCRAASAPGSNTNHPLISPYVTSRRSGLCCLLRIEAGGATLWWIVPVCLTCRTSAWLQQMTGVTLMRDHRLQVLSNLKANWGNTPAGGRNAAMCWYPTSKKKKKRRRKKKK